MMSGHSASFHVSVGDVYVFFGEVSVQVFSPFLNWIVFGGGVRARVSRVRMWECISSLYILDTNPLSNMSFANIFSHQ